MRLATGLALVATLTACSALPSSGPTGPEIQDALKDSNPLGIKVVDVTPTVVSELAAAAAADEEKAAPPPVVPPDVDRIGPGDELSISIFQIGTGLFSGQHDTGTAEQEPAGSAQQELPKLLVNGKGYIFVPYAGRVRAGGLTPAEVQKAIEDRLRSQALNPQVVVSVVTNVSNTVVVSGDVKSPGRQKLTLAHETLLDAIALAGGTTHLAADMLVKLQGTHHSETLPLALVELDSKENVIMEPGDRVEVDFQPRTISVFGAGGKVAQLPFDTPHLTLAEALARSGGPADYQADAAAIYLFRFEKPSAAQKLGLAATNGATPVLYHADLLDPTTYFSVQQFAMRDRDVLYIANARANKLQKIMGIVSGVFTPLSVGKQVSE